MTESVMTFESEVWVVNKNMSQKFLVVEMAYWRRCCELTLPD